MERIVGLFWLWGMKYNLNDDSGIWWVVKISRFKKTKMGNLIYISPTEGEFLVNKSGGKSEAIYVHLINGNFNRG